MKNQSNQNQVTSLDTFLTTLKSKAINDYSLLELQEVIEEISNRYKATRVKEERKQLASTYAIIAENYNKRVPKRIYSKTIYE